MEMNDKLKKIPEYDVLGKQCWNPQGVAQAVGVHKNTVLRWIKKTMEGSLNLPIMRAPVDGSNVYIPIDDFLVWYGYTQN